MEGGRYFGDGLTYLNPSDLKGKLVAIEGTDGVGRSTHIESLQEWLEIQGYGVVTTGWTRSNLMSKTIEMAKQGNILDRWSFSLLYATDFADRLEHQVIPALRSGFIVLADRYIYTAFARDLVRSGDRKWIRDVFGFALIPDLVCYLRIDVDTLALRVIESNGMNYWESGMDLRLGTDLYDSFKKYQGLLIEEFDKMAEEFQFEVIDARKPPDDIQDELRTKIQSMLATEKSLTCRRPMINFGALSKVRPLPQRLPQRAQLTGCQPPLQDSPARSHAFRKVNQAGSRFLQSEASRRLSKNHAACRIPQVRFMPHADHGDLRGERCQQGE